MGKTQSKIDVDKVIADAVTSWDASTGTATVAKVLALRPLVKVAPNAQTRRKFASMVAGDKSSVGRFWQAAELTLKHDMSDDEVAPVALDLVAALKEKGASEALSKSRTAETMSKTAKRIADKGRAAKRGSRASSPRKSDKVAERETIAQQSLRLTERLMAISKAKDGDKVEAISAKDLESLSQLAQVIAAVSVIPARVPNTSRRAKVA